MLAKMFEKNLELSSCWFSAWNVHMWSLPQLSSQHVFLAETFSSRCNISSTIISCRISCFTVNIFFVLPGEKHLDPESFHASPTLTRSLSPSSYFSALRLLPLFLFLLFCGCLFFVTGKSQHCADFRPTEILLIPPKLFLSYLQSLKSIRCHIEIQKQKE